MVDTRIFSLISPEGLELSIGIPVDAFDRPLLTDPKTGEPASPKTLGYALGFDASTGAPYNDAAVKAAAKGNKTIAARAKAAGVAAVFGPEQAPETEPVPKATVEKGND